MRKVLLCTSALLSACLFMTISRAQSGSVTFVRADTTTQGNWHGAYGADGFSLAGDAQSVPSYATFAVQNQAEWTWSTETTDVRALQTGNGVGRLAATWYNSPTFTFDVNFTDGQSHQFALYAIDWDSLGRAETIQILDAATQTPLNTQSISGFTNGVFLVWNISGHVTVSVTGTGGPNAVISGAFFGGSSTITATAGFVRSDSTTQGNWHATYGADGYSVANDSQSIPSYATLAIQNQSGWTYSPESTDVRALQTGSGVGRIAATWYNDPSFSFDVNIADGNSHQFALYAIDWDNLGRAETVQVLDAATEAVLNTQNISGLANGVYLVWTISGHVKINVIATAGPNAAVSGVFFGGGSSITSSTNFVRSDTTTQGNWHSMYGADGYSVAGDSLSVPSYVTFAAQNQSLWTYSSESADVRALQTGSGVGRIAATWYNSASLTFDLNFTDGNSHQFALYAIDWDNLGRAESIQVMDAATEALLDTRSISAFTNGLYLVWNLSGHVKINVISTNGPNAVISGVFFGASNAITSTASFVRSDTTTEGNWHGAYGADGYSVTNDSQSIPSYATFALQNQAAWTWAAQTTDPRALQTGSGVGRIAATWYNSPSFALDVNLTDGNSHQIALYAVDWDSLGRAETIQVVDAGTEAVLDTENLSGFPSGTYLAWKISGHVRINVIGTSGPNAIISGVFFGGSSAITSTAKFVASDTTTQGSWHATYGPEGYSVANDSQSLPSYASFAIQNQSGWTYAVNPSDPRALQTGSGTGRIAAVWYNNPSFSFDVNFTDGQAHEFALYAIDWDNLGRAETIQVLDAATEALLDTENISGFNNGEYLVWTVSGHVKINVICTGGPNAAVSGVFFGSTASTAPTVTGLSPTGGSPGTLILISGSNFGSTQGSSTVTFNGTVATPTIWSTGSIVGPVPTGATTGNVVVTVAGVPSNPVGFTVIAGTPPTITASALPAPNANGWNNSNVTVAFTCTPGSAAIVSCPAPQTISSEGGGQFVSATVTDASGIMATATLTLNIDKTIPALAVTSPADSAGFSSSPITVTGTVTDALSGVSGVTCNGAPATVSGGNFSCNISLTVGVNLLVVRAADVAGNVAGSNMHLILVGSLPAPTSLQIAPATANVLVGATQQFTAVDQLGRPSSDATWTVDNTNIAIITTESAPTLTGVAAGTVTLTASVGSVSAQIQVHILGGSSLPAGTVLWSAPALTGFKTLQIVQALSTASGPDLFAHEADTNGDRQVRAFSSGGQPLWQATLVGPSDDGVDFASGLIPDGFGGTLVRHDHNFAVGTFLATQTTFTDLDFATGSQLWSYTSPGQLSTPAIGRDGTIFSTEESVPDLNNGGRPDGTSLIALDPTVGMPTLHQPLPISEYTTYDSSGNLISDFKTGPQLLSNLAIDSNGNVGLLTETDTELVTSYGNGTSSLISFTSTLSLFQLKSDGSTSLTPIHSNTSTTGAPRMWPGSLIPDGQGGWLASWTNQAQAQPVYVSHVSSSASSDYPFPALYCKFACESMVLGENNAAYVADGQTIQAFDLTSGKSFWSYTSQLNGVDFVTSTAGDGLVAKEFNLDNSETILRFDSSGNLTRDSWAGTGVGYWAGTLWPVFSSSTPLSVDSAPLLQFSTSAWPALDMFASNRARQDVSVANFSQTGPNQAAIVSALQKIQADLPSYSSCNNWLQGGGSFTGLSGLQQIQNLLGSNFFGHGTVNLGSKPYYDNIAFSASLNPDKTPIPGLPENPAPVFTVNDNGAFFNAADNQGRQFRVGKQGYPGNSLRAQLAVLLHEVAHQITVSGFQDDFGIPKAGEANDGLVDTYCRGLIEGPSIRSVNPSSGPVGTVVTITGKNFGMPQGASTVSFNRGVTATPTSWGDTQIVVMVPSGATSGNIVVAVGGQAGQTASKNFTVQ